MVSGNDGLMGLFLGIKLFFDTVCPSLFHLSHYNQLFPSPFFLASGGKDFVVGGEGEGRNARFFALNIISPRYETKIICVITLFSI